MSKRRKKTKLHKSSKVLQKAKETKWCCVNTDNEFIFKDDTFVISNSVIEYKVHKKSGEVEDYTNEAEMDTVLVVVYDDEISFYNQNFEEISPAAVKKKQGVDIVELDEINP